MYFYNIAEIFGANIDWPAWNIKFWKEKKEGAKWKWVLVDMDYSFGNGAKWDFNMLEYATAPTHTSSKKANMSLATVLLRKMLEFGVQHKLTIMDFYLSRDHLSHKLEIVYRNKVPHILGELESSASY